MYPKRNACHLRIVNNIGYFADVFGSLRCDGCVCAFLQKIEQKQGYFFVLCFYCEIEAGNYFRIFHVVCFFRLRLIALTIQRYDVSNYCASIYTIILKLFFRQRKSPARHDSEPGKTKRNESLALGGVIVVNYEFSKNWMSFAVCLRENKCPIKFYRLFFAMQTVLNREF